MKWETTVSKMCCGKIIFSACWSLSQESPQQLTFSMPRASITIRSIWRRQRPNKKKNIYTRAKILWNLPISRASLSLSHHHHFHSFQQFTSHITRSYVRRGFDVMPLHCSGQHTRYRWGSIEISRSKMVSNKKKIDCKADLEAWCVLTFICFK